MHDADKPRFLATVDAMATLKPTAKGSLTPEAKELFWRAMRGTWTLEEFQAAATRLLSTSQFMPDPYQFDQLRSAASDQAAGDAWAGVVLVNRYGRTGRESLVTPRIERIVAAMGGWHALAMMRTEELPFRERRFRELWDEFSEADQAQAVLPHLASTSRITGPKSTAALMPKIARAS